MAAAGVSPVVEWCGALSYAEGLTLQERAVAARIAGAREDRILLLEHPPVVTLGRSTDPSNLRRSPEELRDAGIDVFEVGRGGDVTYHAPGQLVGYPILDLARLDRKDVHDHLRRLEAALIDAVESFGVPCRRVEGRTGVFVDRSRSASPTGPERKIASIGVGLRKWVTFHGFALNVSIDLSGFDAIVPCGLHDVEMTSVARELARERRTVSRGGAALDPSEAAGSSAALDEPVRDAVAAALVGWLARDAPRPA